MGKTRVGVIIREGMSGAKSSNASADLQSLTAKYQTFAEKLRLLREALQQHLASMQQIEKTRTNVAQKFATFAKNTPLWEAAGQMPGGDRPVDSVCSYSSVHDLLSSKSKSYATKYQQHVIDYVVEWEKTVTARVDTGLKKAAELRRELDHYQKKVESLRLSTNKALATGKAVKSETQEKLKRNEEKLITAKQTYNKVTSALCILMDEVSERSWRDLHPLLIKAVQFDMTLSADESNILATFSQVVNTLKGVGAANGISPQHRLKDLGSLNPELLTTRPGGASGLAIQASGSSISPSNSVSGSASGSPMSSNNAFDPMALPPGSVGAQGMGGYPVAVANYSGELAVSRASSFSSFNSTGNNEPPSTLHMLSISQSAAPPPTMEDVYSAGFNSSAPAYNRSSSSSLPPLPPTPSGGFNNNYRSSSFSDYEPRGSMGALVGPPAAPPPPPPPSDNPYGAYGGGGMPPQQLSYGNPNQMMMVPAVSSSGPYAPSQPYGGSGGYGNANQYPPNPNANNNYYNSPYGPPPQAPHNQSNSFGY